MNLAVVGGMDPTGGAGVLRDAWTIARIDPDARFQCVVTALTSQGRGVSSASSSPVASAVLATSLSRLVRPRVVKLGLVPATVASTVATWLRDAAGGPVVLDPVGQATDGGSLGASAAGYMECCGADTVLTPNLLEARWLLGDTAEPSAMAAALAERTGAAAVLVKGGHAPPGAEVSDVLWERGAVRRFTRPRVEGPDIRGTGCALASAIAVHLSRRAPVADAVAAAISWLDSMRAAARPGMDGRHHLPARES